MQACEAKNIKRYSAPLTSDQLKECESRPKRGYCLHYSLVNAESWKSDSGIGYGCPATTPNLAWLNDALTRLQPVALRKSFDGAAP